MQEAIRRNVGTAKGGTNEARVVKTFTRREGGREGRGRARARRPTDARWTDGRPFRTMPQSVCNEYAKPSVGIIPQHTPTHPTHNFVVPRTLLVG